MTDLLSPDPVTARDSEDPAVAFEQMSRRLAGLTAAVEGFAARQQELHARDYGPDLAGIRDWQEEAMNAIDDLGKRPAMALTPEMIDSQIKTAGEVVRADDHKAWRDACREAATGGGRPESNVSVRRDPRTPPMNSVADGFCIRYDAS